MSKKKGKNLIHAPLRPASSFKGDLAWCNQEAIQSLIRLGNKPAVKYAASSQTQTIS